MKGLLMDPISESHSKKKASASGSIDFNIYEQLRSEIQHLKQELIAASEQNVDLAIQLGQIDELNAAVAERNGKIAVLANEAAALRASIKTLQESLASETEQVKKSNQRIAELLALETELKESLKKSQAECLQMKLQIEEHQASIANLQNLLATAQASNARHMEALESLEKYISKPKENDQEATPPMLRLKNALQELLGTAGQVIFNRTCRTLGIHENDFAKCSAEVLKNVAAAVVAPSLRLCRKEETVQALKERIKNICAPDGQLSYDMQSILNGTGKTPSVLSTLKTPAAPSAIINLTYSEIETEKKTAEITPELPFSPASSVPQSEQATLNHEKHPAEDEVQQDIGLFVPYAYNTVDDEYDEDEDTESSSSSIELTTEAEDNSDSKELQEEETEAEDNSDSEELQEQEEETEAEDNSDSEEL
ncbi:MAG: hypothetical protein ACI38Q_00075, partial [Candidatus Bruticola sp.]